MKRTTFLTGLVLIAALGASCSDLPMSGGTFTSGNFPINLNFDNNSFGVLYKEAASVASIAIVPAPAGITGGSGTNCCKLVVTPQDLANNGNRSELAAYHTGNYGQTMYFGWDLAVPADDPDNYQWQIAGQWYQLPDFERGETFDYWGAHPPVHIVLVPGKVQLKTTVGGDRQRAEKSFSKGVWHRLIVGIRFSDDASGSIEAWLDGQALLDSPLRTQTLWNKAGTYFKFGLYRGSPGQTQASGTNTIYVDNLKIARSKAEVL